jgi:hypothetical protein
MDIGGNKLKMVESRLNVINTQIDQTTGLMNKTSVAVKSAKRLVDLLIWFLKHLCLFELSYQTCRSFISFSSIVIYCGFLVLSLNITTDEHLTVVTAVWVHTVAFVGLDKQLILFMTE